MMTKLCLHTDSMILLYILPKLLQLFLREHVSTNSLKVIKFKEKTLLNEENCPITMKISGANLYTVNKECTIFRKIHVLVTQNIFRQMLIPISLFAGGIKKLLIL